MIKHGIQNYVNHRLQSNVKLILPMVDSTTSCTLSHFTTLKSGILVDFSALPGESGNVVTLYHSKVLQWCRGNVVALYRGNVVAWCCGSVLKCPTGTSVAASGHRRQGYTRGASWKLRAGSCELETSWKQAESELETS